MAKPPKKKPDLAETEKSVRRISAGLGWVRDLPDPRDRIYSAPLEVLKALPDHTEIEPEFPIYDQGRIGSCTANALAGAVQFDRKKNKQSPDFIPSRLFIYFNERQIEGHIANDAGAQLRDGIKTLQKFGVCPDSDWPYDDTPASYEGGPFPPHSKPATKPDLASYQDARKYIITNYQRLTPTLSQLQGCLAAGFPFVFGFTVFNDWYSKDPRPSTIPLPAANDRAIGGHAVMCVGYDNRTQLFKIRNSWGPSQGKHGYFFMPYAYLTAGNLASDFWTINAVKD
jgi:C1A family cysteine protease